MELQQQVTSLELSKKMKELGFKQDSLFWYRVGCGTRLMCNEYLPQFDASDCYEKFSAYTVAELGEMLPNKIKGNNGGDAYLNIDKLDNGKWEISYSETCERCTISPFIDNLVSAMSQMLIYLKENKLI